MKLNNKGFAITGILYTILILFVLLLSSLLAILSARVNRLSTINDDINNEIIYNNLINEDDALIVGDDYYITKYRGKYEFTINDNKTCYSYLPNNALIKISDGKLQYKTYPSDSQCMIDPIDSTDFSDLNMINCDNNDISTISFNSVYTSQDKEDSSNSDPLSKLGLSNLLKSGTPDFSTSATTDEGIYAAEDDFGTSYYFRGASTRNYVKFGKYKNNLVLGYNLDYSSMTTYGWEYYIDNDSCMSDGKRGCNVVNNKGDDMYWRIVRINGDGTIRMIYDGTKSHDNGDIDSNRVILPNTVSYGSSYSIGMYATPYAYKHPFSGEIKHNLILQTVNDWYGTYFSETGRQYIADAVYCNDRNNEMIIPDINNDGWADAGPIHNYGSAQRIKYKTPSLKCSIFSDRNTVSNNIGNGYLTYPVGLITADEVMFAGVTMATDQYGRDAPVGNSKYYLYSGTPYWTMSPINSFDTSSYIYAIGFNGELSSNLQYRQFGLKPVISLKNNITFTGTGTKEDPFIPIDICS